MEIRSPRPDDRKKLLIVLFAILFIAGGIILFLALPHSQGPGASAVRTLEEEGPPPEASRLHEVKGDDQKELDKMHQLDPASTPPVEAPVPEDAPVTPRE